jgi:hypothetical protein
MTYVITNPDLFAAVDTFDVCGTMSRGNVEIILKDGTHQEWDGEFGPNDFAEFGIRLSK